VDLLGKEDLKNDKAKEHLEVLQRQSQRLKKLLQDLLDASKASTGNVELHMEKVDAGVLLNQTLGEFKEKLQKSGVELKVKMPSSSPSITADSRYLWRVFDNLMNNICKYGASGTRAYINLEVKDAKVILTFLNTSKEELNISTEELMQRFVRGDSSRNTEGSGLGLSIAQSLTELMGGEMKLSVEGDLFKVELLFPSC
jgi:signal transduction histidine kinase